jgi:hypothetical protein
MSYTKIYVFGKPVGKVENGVFYKVVDSAVHFLKIPPAICVDKRSLEQAEEIGATEIEIFDKRNKITYHTTAKFLRKNAIDINRGYGEQYALAIDKWTIKDPHQIELSL